MQQGQVGELTLLGAGGDRVEWGLESGEVGKDEVAGPVADKRCPTDYSIFSYPSGIEGNSIFSRRSVS